MFSFASFMNLFTKSILHSFEIVNKITNIYIKKQTGVPSVFYLFSNRLVGEHGANKFEGLRLFHTGSAPRIPNGDTYLGVQEAEARGDGWEAAVLGNTVTLLTQMKRATDGHTAKHLRAETPELLDQITDYIERHYGEEITLDLLSRRFFVSRSTISHLFKQKLGVSLYRYVTQRRLIAAKSFIEAGLPLERVATQSGFCDYSVFFRAFKGAFGISPRQYKAIQ